MLIGKQKKILDHAYRTVPYYMDKQKEFDLSSINKWEEIPIVEKETFVLKNNSFISAQYLATCLQGKLLHVQTSGSTGLCASVFWDIADCKRSLLPLWMKRKKDYDINPHDKYCYFYTGRNVGDSDKEIEKSSFSLGFCKSNLNDEKLVDIWESMRKFKPVWMNLQPSMAVLLCRVIKKYDLERISTLRYLEMTGEMLFSQIRNYIQETLNVTIANQYGCNELNSLAFECTEGHLHCMEDNAVIEIVDDQGNLLPDGEEGEIVVTTLNNYAMPLIRYKIGDRGRFIMQKCQCGSKEKVLELTTGRSNDFVVDKEGNLLNAYIFARCVENVNKLEEHAILQFQVIQHTIDDFTLKLVLDDECEPDMICQYFMDNLWQTSLMGARFQIQLHQNLLPEAETGKLRWFINEMDIDFYSK